MRLDTKKLRENFATLMLELGRKNKDLCVMVGDISHGILQPFAKEFPDISVDCKYMISRTRLPKIMMLGKSTFSAHFLTIFEIFHF